MSAMLKIQTTGSSTKQYLTESTWWKRIETWLLQRLESRHDSTDSSISKIIYHHQTVNVHTDNILVWFSIASRGLIPEWAKNWRKYLVILERRSDQKYWICNIRMDVSLDAFLWWGKGMDGKEEPTEIPTKVVAFQYSSGVQLVFIILVLL